jgi:hypothetical protein
MLKRSANSVLFHEVLEEMNTTHPPPLISADRKVLGWRTGI